MRFNAVAAPIPGACLLLLTLSPPVAAQEGAARHPAKAPRRYSAEEVVRDRPAGEITVQFRVHDTGVILAPRPVNALPYDPVMLDASPHEKGKSRFYVILVGKVLAHLHAAGIEDLRTHLRGRVVQATGKVRYIDLPRITHPDGTVEIPREHWTDCELVVDDLDRFFVSPKSP
jgi:hypothetical protein